MVINKVVENNTGKSIRKNGYFLLCEVCKKEIYIKKSVFDKANSLTTKRCFFCGKDCQSSKEGTEILQKNMLDNYGWKNPAQNPVVIEKNRKYFMEKFGSPSPFGSKEVLEKTKATIKERYNVNNVRELDWVNDKIKNTSKEKYGNEFFFASDGGKMNLENFKRWHGNEAEEKYNSFRLKCRTTIDRMIDIYGKEQGILKYFKWKEAITSGFKHKKNNVSKIEKEISSYIKTITKKEVMEQKRIISEEGRFFYYDICIEDFKIIFEINGNYWHANPEIYKEDEIINFPFGKLEAGKIWLEDKIKKDVAVKNGYKVFYIWEKTDYKKYLEFLREW